MRPPWEERKRLFEADEPELPRSGQDPLHNRRQPVVQARRWRHSWDHANEAGCRDNTRSVLGYGATEDAEPPAAPQGKAAPDNSAEQTRYLLPKDLAGALQRLDDKEVDTLFEAVTSEAERRGRLLRTPVSRTPSIEDAGGSLTKGKLNAVRAAFKAGVKPAVIARQFGISQGDVKRALAAEAWNQKSRR